MLKEYKEIKQEINEFRRFFSNENYDLMVWYFEDKKSVVGYQISYDKSLLEKVITFKYENDKFIKSHRINEDWGSNTTSILKKDVGKMNIDIIQKVLKELSEEEKEIVQYIKKSIDRMQEY